MPPTPAQAIASPAGRLIHGALVEVRSARDIAATLDARGQLDGLAFMPEMAAHCGRRYRVRRRADVTCVEGLGLRRLESTVLLDDLRCDGAAHDGCQRRCMMFWKEAWLKPVDESDPVSPAEPVVDAPRWPTRDGERYICQSTALAEATRELPPWNALPFVSQIRDGELTLIRFGQIILRALANRLRVSVGLRDIGRLVGDKSKSTKGLSALKPGDRVRVRPLAEIAATLDPAGRNRGMLFEPEMSEYTGRESTVAFTIDRMIHEETGRMIEVANTVALTGLTCQGLCAKSCPRGNYWYWRRDWLEPLSPATGAG